MYERIVDASDEWIGIEAWMLGENSGLSKFKRLVALGYTEEGALECVKQLLLLPDDDGSRTQYWYDLLDQAQNSDLQT